MACVQSYAWTPVQLETHRGRWRSLVVLTASALTYVHGQQLTSAPRLGILWLRAGIMLHAVGDAKPST